ncbi:ABC transporter substrate-binding protein [Arsenicitalea aurantiaca]|nr:ABC transporter substrate-binding protein [Arsenicitalea aurantiaca]
MLLPTGKLPLSLAAFTACALLCGTSALAQDAFNCPATGGDLIVGMEASMSSLDQHTNTSSATRNVAMNIFETLVIRDEEMNPVADLADTISVSDDGLTYTFTLREGVSFHNGKPLTSADVLASFDRYRDVGINRASLDVVEGWEAPDDMTFVITLVRVQPTFLESLSSYTVPIVIMPAEEAAKPAGQIDPIGTGPFEFVEFVPDSHVRLARYDGYVPNETLPELSGFAGRKQACVDTVTFRMLTEPGARMAALETGEIHIAENVPTVSQERLANTEGVELLRLQNFALNIGYPNWSAPPTDNRLVRQAMLAALDMEEIMEAATDGAYELNASFQFPGQGYYSTAGEEFYNQADPDRARELLAEAGYNNEPIVLLTNQQFPSMYNSALVMAAQLQAAGMNAELRVLDWPTALATSEQETQGWNFFYTFWATVTAQGGPTSLRNLADPNNVYKPVDNVGDPDFNAAFDAIEAGETIEERREAFARAQEIAFEEVMAIPFGIMSNAQGIRTEVEGFVPFYNTRVSNVWFAQ